MRGKLWLALAVVACLGTFSAFPATASAQYVYPYYSSPAYVYTTPVYPTTTVYSSYYPGAYTYVPTTTTYYYSYPTYYSSYPYYGGYSYRSYYGRPWVGYRRWWW